MSEYQIRSSVSADVTVDEVTAKYRPAYEYNGGDYSASVRIQFGLHSASSVTLSMADARKLAKSLPAILAEHDALVSGPVSLVKAA
ncbi:hypothetical protein [Nocardia noduli]|uniref:hypothetical protein n=1 Tax=Nocardia noduli TaxID=2815722 RepID=UPI001C244BB3|nr:hypothetical protein [Nocardia noduli]